MLAKENELALYLNNLDLQFFAGEGEEGKEGEDKPEQKEDVKEPEKKEPEKKEESQGKQYSDQELKDLLKGKTEEGQKKLLKTLGFDDVDSLQAALKAYKDYEDSKKTQEQLTQDKLTDYENKTKNLEDELTNTKAQLAVVKAGVKEEAINDVIILAKNLVDDKTDFEKAVKSVLEKYPQFKDQKEKQEEEKKPKFSQGQHKQLDENLTEQDIWNQAAAATMLPVFGNGKKKQTT